MGNHSGGAPGQQGQMAQGAMAAPQAGLQNPDGMDIGTGGSDFIEQAGLRHLGGIGAGGDPNEWVSGLVGSGLLSNGDQNSRLNSSAFAAASNPMRGGQQGPAPLPFDRAVDWTNPNANMGPAAPPPAPPLPFDNAVDWTNPNANMGGGSIFPSPLLPPRVGGPDTSMQRPGGPSDIGQQVSPPQGISTPGVWDRLRSRVGNAPIIQNFREHPGQSAATIGATMALGPAGGALARLLFGRINRGRGRGP